MLEAAVARIAEACLEAPLREAPWLHVAQGLARELGSGKAVIVTLAPGWSPWGPSFVTGLDPDMLRSVAETHHRKNPWAGISRRYAQGYFGPGYDHFSPADLRAGAFYNEWMVPAGLGSDVVYGGFPVLRDGVDELLVAVMSATGTREMDPLHLAIGARAMAYLRHTFRLLDQLGSGRLEGGAEDTPWSSRVLDRLGIAALVVDAAGRIRHANRAADELLRSGHALRARKGRLTTTREHETRALLEHLARAASNVANCGGALVVGATADSCGTQLSVSPLPGRGASPGLALLLAAPAHAASLSSVDLLRRSFGLTGAEARLIARLAAVLDLRQAADAERISYETARTYFKRAADKLGVRTQTAAIDRVRQLAMLGDE